MTRPRRPHRAAAGAPAPGSARVVLQHVPIAQPSAPSGLRAVANLVHECGRHLDLQPNFTGPGKTIHAALPRTPD
ncbi:hypothetical protein [Streptacidiphilus carbonis]|uniref:hypothetical protein n=1 Tax=Streptacidiphilus carbonis TaxID=105422 RepID=UPI0005AAF81B|nr:hypothetical protein [Streptacidiphilus carbonis]